MNAPATLQHIRAIDAELVALCDRLDDAECARHFLRDLYSSLPEQAIAPTKEERFKWNCDAEDRMRMSPQYRALTPEAKTVVDWAMSLRPWGKVPTYQRMYIDDFHIDAAKEFFRAAMDAVADDDNVWETAENAKTRVTLIHLEREREEESLAEWRNTQREHERLGYRREA